MKTAKSLKKPFGQAVFSRIRQARYLPWEDAFDVDFEDGVSFLEPHSTVRKACQISPSAQPVQVAADARGIYFEVRYDTGEVAEVAWSFIRELPPQTTPNSTSTPRPGRR